MAQTSLQVIKCHKLTGCCFFHFSHKDTQELGGRRQGPLRVSELFAFSFETGRFSNILSKIVALVN